MYLAASFSPLVSDESSSVIQMAFLWLLSRSRVYVFNFQIFNDFASWILEELPRLGFNQLLELAVYVFCQVWGVSGPAVSLFPPSRTLTTRGSHLRCGLPGPRDTACFFLNLLPTVQIMSIIFLLCH